MKPVNPENPWKTLSSRVVYENPWIKVREDRVVRPDGKDGIYGVVDCSIATGVVALTPAREVCLVGQYRYPINQYSWEIIQGGTQDGESPLGAIQRELREEGGLKARSWLQLGDECHLSNCHSSEVGYLYLAWDLESVPASPEGTEVLELRRVSFSKCMQMVASGVIKDAMSIIGLFRTQEYLNCGRGL